MGKKILKAFLVLVALLVLALVCWGLTVYYDWRAWVGFALFLGVAGLVFGFAFLKRMAYRSRQRLRDALEARKGAPRPTTAPVDIKAQWKAAMHTLAQSSLRRRGDPVYVLPWYLMLGKEGSGKTTSLTRARLASPIKEVGQDRIADSTRGIDWWYFDRSVVIDTSGRYVAAEDGSPARDEWKTLLSLLARTRRKEPLNGVVVTIGADVLQFASPDSLAEDGRLMRSRIDELMRLFDAKFPVYLVVTKCDSLYGLDEWASRLPPKTLEQALGYCGGREGMPAVQFLDEAFSSVLDRLRDLRLVLSDRLPSMGAGLLLLPNEFERLRPGLEKYFASAFGDSPYLETPLLRGMFFCSGMQRGSTTSFVLKDSGLPEQTVILSAKSAGLFLHDLFDRVVPSDRRMHRPLNLFTRWERITRSAGYAAVMLGALAIGIALTLAFSHNLGTAQKLAADYPAAGSLTGRLESDLDTLRRQHLVLRELHKRNDSWETRRTWLGDNVLALEGRARAHFVDQFRKGVLAKLDQQLAFNVTQLTQAGGDSGQTAFVQFVVRRLNMLKARLDGQVDVQALAGLPAPAPGGTAVMRLAALQGAEGLAAGTAGSFNEVYGAYLAWTRDLHALESERDALKKWLRQLALSEENLSWLVAWANEQSAVEPLLLSTFWPGEASTDRTVSIEPAYTQRGKLAIQGFFKELEAAVAEPQTVAARRKAFDPWYRERRFEAWRLFIENFDVGRDGVPGEAGWGALLPRMATLEQPYFRLLERVAGEFDPVEAAGAPDWLRVARQLVAIRPVGRTAGLIDSAARATGVLNSSGKQIIQGVLDEGTTRGRAVFDRTMEASKSYEAYQAELGKIAKDAVEGPGKAAKLSADFHLFSIDPAVKDSSLHKAYAALAKMKEQLGGETAENRAAWLLAAGPLQYMLAYVEEQGACALQKEWDAKVFFPTQGASSGADLLDILYGAKGTVWTFANETAKPFLQRTATEYKPVETLGVRLAFDSTFLRFINEATAQKVSQANAQKKDQLEQQATQLERQRRQAETKKKQDGTQRQLQEAQAKLREVEQSLVEGRQAADQLRAAAYAINISALPTGVNAGARANPFETVLTVQCAPTPVSLNNFNFPVAATVNWSEKTCGDTTLQIKLDNLVLVRRYTGPQGLPRFLQEFYSGERIFTPLDFPAERARLEALGVTSLSVRYRFAGHDNLLKQTERLQALALQDRDRLQTKQRYEAQRDRIERELAAEKLRENEQKVGDLTSDENTVAAKIDLLDNQPAIDLSGVPKRVLACWDQVPRRAPLKGAPSAGVVRVSAPAAKPAPSATGRYGVQVGWFAQPFAEPLAKRLRDEGHSVSLFESRDDKGQRLVRVRIGPYADMREAQAVAEKIDAAYQLKSAPLDYGPGPRAEATPPATKPPAPPPAAVAR